MIKKCLIYVFLILLPGCTMNKLVVNQRVIPLASDLELILVNTNSGGDDYPGINGDRAFLREKDENDKTMRIHHVDSAFGTDPSLKNVLISGPVSIAVNGGLNYATAGRFKPSTSTSTTAISASASPNMSQDANLSGGDNNNNLLGGDNYNENTANGGSIHDFSVGETTNNLRVKPQYKKPPEKYPPHHNPPHHKPPNHKPPTKGWK